MSVGCLVRMLRSPTGFISPSRRVFLRVFVVAKCLRKLFFLGGGLASINEASLVFLLLVVREFLNF